MRVRTSDEKSNQNTTLWRHPCLVQAVLQLGWCCWVSLTLAGSRTCAHQMGLLALCSSCWYMLLQLHLKHCCWPGTTAGQVLSPHAKLGDSSTCIGQVLCATAATISMYGRLQRHARGSGAYCLTISAALRLQVSALSRPLVAVVL